MFHGVIQKIIVAQFFLDTVYIINDNYILRAHAQYIAGHKVIFTVHTSS